jgi:uncharacterized protein (DUF1800 family)
MTAVHRRAGLLTTHRRQLLLGLGAGAIATGALGSAFAALGRDGLRPALSGGPTSPLDAGAFADRDASYGEAIGEAADLGAAGLEGSPEEAARAATGVTPTRTSPLSRDPVTHLLRRTTFGPTPAGHQQAATLGINAWLDRQLDPAAIADPVADSAVAQFPTAGMTTAQIRQAIEEHSWDAMFELGRATLARQFWSERQLFEVMVDFWSNHLHVTCPFGGAWSSRTGYDRDVIRAHALGRFSDLLHASARHPAMLRYLDNDRSHRRSVNENYGRELLELHTVGVASGYTEKDVRDSAYLMTGRTVDQRDEFGYQPDRHWIDPVRVLDFRHANATRPGGLAAGDEYLRYLATHPATATNIARKLAVRFVTDQPPTGLVDRLAASYLDNNTAVVPVLRTLFSSVEFWIASGRKTRRPLENLVATVRTLGIGPGPDTAGALEQLYWLSDQLGQPPLAWRPPDGYPDVAAAWGGAHGTLAVWNSHRALAHGWHDGLSYPSLASLVADPPPTAGDYLAALAQRLLFQPIEARHRQALLELVEAGEDTPTGQAGLDRSAQRLVPILLDSAYHALR